MKKANKAKVKADAKDLAVKAISASREHKKEKRRRKVRKSIQTHVMIPAFRNLFLLGLGFFAGVHKDELIEYAKTGKKPEFMKKLQNAAKKLGLSKA